MKDGEKEKEEEANRVRQDRKTKKGNTHTREERRDMEKKGGDTNLLQTQQFQEGSTLAYDTLPW